MKRAKARELEKREKHDKPGAPIGICSYKYPLVYISVPKSACTTIKNLLYVIDNGVAYHSPITIHGDKTALLLPSHPDKGLFLSAFQKRKIAFSFVREPFARAYSSFNEKIYAEVRNSFPRARKCLVDKYGADFSTTEAYTAERHGANFLKFLNFVQDSVAGKAPLRLNPHWAPQHILLMRPRRKLNLDFVGKVENFEAGMRFVLDMAGVDAPVDLSVRHNEGPKAPFPLGEILNEEIYQKLSSVYGEDVEYFGYHAQSAKWARQSA